MVENLQCSKKRSRLKAWSGKECCFGVCKKVNVGPLTSAALVKYIIGLRHCIGELKKEFHLDVSMQIARFHKLFESFADFNNYFLHSIIPIQLTRFHINIVRSEAILLLAILLYSDALHEVAISSSLWIFLFSFQPFGVSYCYSLGPSAVRHSFYPRAPVTFPFQAFLNHTLHSRPVLHPVVRWMIKESDHEHWSLNASSWNDKVFQGDFIGDHNLHHIF